MAKHVIGQPVMPKFDPSQALAKFKKSSNVCFISTPAIFALPAVPYILCICMRIRCVWYYAMPPGSVQHVMGQALIQHGAYIEVLMFLSIL